MLELFIGLLVGMVLFLILLRYITKMATLLLIVGFALFVVITLIFLELLGIFHFIF